jgi:hypothetical protein
MAITSESLLTIQRAAVAFASLSIGLVISCWNPAFHSEAYV